MKSLISKGKDTKTAITLGLELMNAKSEDVQIEIIRKESKGFIGLGKKQAIVKLYKEEKVEEEPFKHESPSSIEALIESLPDDHDPNTKRRQLSEGRTNKGNAREVDGTAAQEGLAWVQDGKLHVSDTKISYPTIVIQQGIVLFINQERVHSNKIIVAETDHIVVDIEPGPEQETKMKLELDQHKLTATLKIEPGFTTVRTLNDVEPGQQIELTFKEEKIMKNHTTFEEVMDELNRLHVTYGIDSNAIIQAIEAKQPGSFQVAKGKMAEQGENGRIILQVDVDTRNGLVEDEQGNVNFREIKSIPTVTEGEVIAEILPAIPGKPGMTVTNEPLPPKQTHPIIVKTNKGTTMINDKIVALNSGRPDIEQRGQLVKASVISKLVHQGNVNLESGNIHFNGDVDIMGTVEDHMIVDATGDIHVFQSVNESEITTLKSIVVRENVIGSQLSAGKSNMLVVELGQILGSMSPQLKQMIAVIQQLVHSAAFKKSDFRVGGLQPLIKILLEKKFQAFLTNVKAYLAVYEKDRKYLEEETEWGKLSETIQRIFIMHSTSLITIGELEQLVEQMSDMYAFSQTPVAPDAYITLSSVMNSNLYCSGNIHILGKGCVHSKIHAGGELKVDGVVRGGEVYGKLGIRINETGAKSGTTTIIAVPFDQHIYIENAMEGTVVKFGSISRIIQENRNHLHAYVDDRGEISFT